MDVLATAALAALRQVQPHGPYYLIGDCLGGKLAYQLALALKDAGEEVAFLGLLDPPARPSWADQTPEAARWMKVKRTVNAWRGRIVYHSQQLREMGWQEATTYLGEHMAALFPGAIRPQSTIRSQFLAHHSYRELLSGFAPQTSLQIQATAISSQEFKHHRATWAEIIDDLEVTNIGDEHESILRAHIDETAAVMRKALLASQRQSKSS
jgi:thioesterase domain-containing protein